ncbi:hypothetical protein Golob_007973 [Gossypium lobatum]|uniref:Uncharacterized protein n=1 Tax=Gossypium lobatum TaxID=34289 RepID=A0A7J8ME15_9ROSI|nr:hypothetical protein [Gossypium lobatum]
MVLGSKKDKERSIDLSDTRGASARYYYGGKRSVVERSTRLGCVARWLSTGSF